jgi:hypothetical protein
MSDPVKETEQDGLPAQDPPGEEGTQGEAGL